MPASITLSGRLAADPNVRETRNGNLVELKIPIDTGFGERKQTTWWRCILFGKRAEQAARMLTKGTWVSVTGEPKVDEYEKRDGTRGYQPEVRGFDWHFVGAKVSGAERPATAAPAPRSASAPYSDDNLPF